MEILKTKKMKKPNLQFKVQNLRTAETFTQIVCNEMYQETYKYFDNHPEYLILEVNDIYKHKRDERLKYFQFRILEAEKHIKDVKYIMKRYGANANHELILKFNTKQIQYYTSLINQEI